MAEVKVTFHGICTIMNESPTGAIVAAPRRIVLVNASKRDLFARIPEHARIQPHYARMHIRANDILRIGPLPMQRVEPREDHWIRFDLDQVRVEIANAATGEVDGRRAKCLPHLKVGTVGLLGEPNPDTRNGSYDIACIFHLSSGRLEGLRLPKGAGISILCTETSDPHIELSISRFDGAQSTEIRLRNGADIVVTNLPLRDDHDKDLDFLLHFLTAKALPPEVTVPVACECPAPIGEVNYAGLAPFMTGPGCSNSNYP
jgi:hypothetical protein